LGSLREGRFRDFVPSWRRDVYPRLRAKFREVFEEEISPHDLPCFNWYEAVARHAADSAAIAELVQIHT
jgi:hypothetical protein